MKAHERPVPTRPICSWLTAIVGQLPLADSSGFRILNMFNTDSRLTISESVVESDDSAVESADYMTDYMADFTADSMKIVVWIYKRPVHTEKTVKDYRLKQGFKTGKNYES